jgi:hypothetical protein
MSRRRSQDEAALSLDSFLDIVTNVVGVLILVAVVTVLSAGDIGVPSGASALAAPKSTASRVLFECSKGKVFFVDEEGNGDRVKQEANKASRGAMVSKKALVELLQDKDVGDASHRVTAEPLAHGVAWVYELREHARGETAEEVEKRGSAFQRKLAESGSSFAYFVVHDDSFEAFRRARDVARARGVAVGWHPVEGRTPVRLSAIGSLGRRVQ